MPFPGTVWAPNTWDINAWANHTWADAEAPPTEEDVIMSFMIGPIYTLTASIIYALPARRCLVHIQQSGGTIQVSLDGSTFADITLDDDEQFESAGGFIRAVTTDALAIFSV